MRRPDNICLLRIGVALALFAVLLFLIPHVDSYHCDVSPWIVFLPVFLFGFITVLRFRFSPRDFEIHVSSLASILPHLFPRPPSSFR